MNRREFVYHSSLAGSLVLAEPYSLMKHKVKHIGVQLYSVRDVADKDPVGALHQLRAMGYKEVEGHQYANGKFYTFSPVEFHTVLKNAGIKMPSAHSGINFDHWDPVTKKLNATAKRTIEDHAAIGVKQLICPWIADEWRTSVELKNIADLFNQYGEACRQHGMQFGYHNHDFDFKMVDGKYIIDHILGQTDPELVAWEMDLYWLQYANEDPAKWINTYRDRIHAFHVKDMANSTKRESIEVGEGQIDFGELFALEGVSDVKYYIVELEHYRTTSMQGVQVSLNNLKKMLAAG